MRSREGERSNDRRSTRPENVEIENLMRRPEIGKRSKKKEGDKGGRKPISTSPPDVEHNNEDSHKLV